MRDLEAKKKDACSLLRWKGMFIPAPKDNTVPDCEDHCYWCVHTMTDVGPDDSPVGPEECTSDRSCYAD